MMRSTLRRHSLSTKLLVSVVLWVVCALIFTGYTLALLWQLESGGIAINDAGSLRKRVYHIVALLSLKQDEAELLQEQTNFEHILENLKNIDRTSFLLPKNPSIDIQISNIHNSWQQKVLPLVRHYQQTDEKILAKDLAYFDQFVGDIDSLVKFIEVQNTQHISWLRFIQTILIIMVIFSAFTAIYLLYRLVISPLSRLQEAITHVSHGDLSKRITITSRDEFGTVSVGFNKMASNLEDLYTNLEQKVTEKTAALEEKNHELSALYDITAFLHEAHTQEIMTESFLNNIIHLSNANAGSIRLLDETHDRFNYIASQGLPEALITSSECSSITDCFCGTSVSQDKEVQLISIKNITNPTVAYCIKNSFNHFLIFHIQHNNHEIGIMTLYFINEESKLTPQTQYLIETLTDQLAVALENQQLALSDKQLAVMKERNLIAQGLHDSIAQSLSFLNLQVQMLQTALANNELAQVEKNLNFIQQGVQESYEDVRELLLNFRTRINKEDFKEVIQKLTDRFKLQTKAEVQVTITGNGPSLNPQQQLQVTFILQEALSNIRKHAKCNHVKITFKNDDQFIMTIADNGCGFNKQTIEQKKTRHVGMSIMAERAAQISATIEINSIPNQGTTIILTIPKEQRGIL
ncbi:histidine kinase [Entomomonas asaccharolytica]|uniref:Sensor protein n=1 Tax=Entomomonas asaccharolytica TaxID=2785331 RepID=A0A974NHD9_9GAMM|nr:histidine kinase [Entomomonas asaccharolytica]QQP86771.1 HAMP domain-containing protein [Entomomonas asaccharolytica]